LMEVGARQITKGGEEVPLGSIIVQGKGGGTWRKKKKGSGSRKKTIHCLTKKKGGEKKAVGTEEKRYDRFSFSDSETWAKGNQFRRGVFMNQFPGKEQKGLSHKTVSMGLGRRQKTPTNGHLKREKVAGGEHLARASAEMKVGEKNC